MSNSLKTMVATTFEDDIPQSSQPLVVPPSEEDDLVYDLDSSLKQLLDDSAKDLGSEGHNTTGYLAHVPAHHGTDQLIGGIESEVGKDEKDVTQEEIT